MTDIDKARQLFQEAKLVFPTIPEELAVRLKEQGKWEFSSREIEMWPYNLYEFIEEVDETHVDDYVLLSHAGHGVNSYALQYFLVHGKLEMFLFLGWGGVYMDDRNTDQICDCFSLANKIVPIAQTTEKLQAEARLRIVVSDFYGSYWFVSGKKEREKDVDAKRPAEVLTEALNWLQE